MAEYIERQRAIFPLYRWKNIIKNTCGENDEYVRCLTEAIEKIEDVPAADVAPVRHGRWREGAYAGYRCSECRTTWDAPTNYCPNCGAKMGDDKVNG